MDDPNDATVALLDDRPEIEADLQALLAVDEQNESWSFHDVPVDSGAFGEIVGHGLVEETDDGYVLSDPEAIRAGIDGEVETDSSRNLEFDLDTLLPSVDRNLAAALSVGLLVVALLRLSSFRSVYLDGEVVLSGNDPYYVHYLVDQISAGAEGPLDVSVLSSLPQLAALDDPLFVVVVWWFASLFGGDPEAVRTVLAWFPVVAGVLTALLTYVLATGVTDDRRVGLASVFMLAVIPAFASRTALGFGDHHAFDYLWLVLGAIAMVRLVSETDLERRETWLGVGLLATAVAGQVLAWSAGPLLLVPIGVIVWLQSLLALRNGRSPGLELLPAAIGVGIGAGIVWLAHVGLGWHHTPVAASPGILLAGIVGVVVLAEGASRLELSMRTVLLGEVVTGVAMLGGAVALVPGLQATLSRRLEFFFGAETISESVALFGSDLAYGFGPLIVIGLHFYVAIPYLALGTWSVYRDRADTVLVPAVYAWYFLALASFQMRFVGEFSPFLAVFAGVAFVHIASVVDVLERDRPLFAGETGDSEAGPATGGDRTDFGGLPAVSIPDGRTVGYLCLLFLLIGGLGLIQTPAQINNSTTDAADYRAAAWIEDDAAERGLEHPENYVFTAWSDNRMYNYFVSGEARSYSYAQNNYEDFLAGTTPGVWYEELADQAGYVVTESEDRAAPETSMYTQLQALPEGSGNVAPLEHYRLVYVGEDGSPKVYELVPGATIRGEAEPNGTVRVATTVTVGDRTYEYERSVDVAEDGTYEVRVPYPGTYEVGDETVTVPEKDVRNGETVEPDGSTAGDPES